MIFKFNRHLFIFSKYSRDQDSLANARAIVQGSISESKSKYDNSLVYSPWYSKKIYDSIKNLTSESKTVTDQTNYYNTSRVTSYLCPVA